MDLILLSADEIRAAVAVSAAVDAVAAAYRELSGGRAQSPVRLGLEAPKGVSLFMPAFLADSGALGAKVVSVFQDNPGLGLPVIHGIVLLIDPETGVPTAIMDGTYLTALRTGAGSGAATRALAPIEHKRYRRLRNPSDFRDLAHGDI